MTHTATNTSPIVEMRGISIEFPAVKALDDVDFRLFAGEVHALMGENGAGKSTLIKALTGVYGIDAGTVLIDGQQRQLHGTADAQEAGVAVVYQEVNLCANLTVGENVMLGHEIRKRFGIDWKATHEAATSALEHLGIGHIDTRRPLSSLSLAMQQLVAISRSMVTRSKVLILDEPTSSLDSKEVEQLFTIIRRLRDDGVAILFVSHFLDQVFAISDRMSILRNGKFEGEFLTSELDRSTLISTMIGKDLLAMHALRERDGQSAAAEAVLVATGVGLAGSVEPTDVSLHRSEVVGLAGLLGSGRTELARLLFGADRADTGTIEVHGQQVTLNSPSTGLGNQIAFSSENRRDEGIVADLTVRENMVLAVQGRRGWMRPLSRREQNEIVEKYIAELGVRPADPDIPIKNLSGGNQQKVLLGRWLATQPEILILDEPTRGIDVGAKAEIMTSVADLSDTGVSVVFISSELDEVVRLCDRVIVMKDRHKIGEIEVDGDTTTDTIVSVIAGHGASA